MPFPKEVVPTKTKLSLSIARDLAEFVERYRDQHWIATRSRVVERALALLREHDLEDAYRAASDEDDRAWEAVIEDGLGDARRRS